MLSLAFVVSSLVTLSLVSPAKAAFTPTTCGLAESTGNATADEATFLLAAVFKSNTSQTQLGLVLDPSAGINTPWIGSVASANTTLSLRFTMSQGWITARTPDGSVVGLSKSVGQENGLLEFTAGQASPDPNTSPPYCVMYNHTMGISHSLAVNQNVMDNFRLCDLSGNKGGRIVVYNGVGDSSVYDSGSCAEVEIAVYLL